MLIVASMDMGQLVPEFRASVSPIVAKQGSLRVVFYGNSFDKHISHSALIVPASGWEVIYGQDSTTLVANDGAKPLQIVANDDEVAFVLVRHSMGGGALLENGQGFQSKFDLRSPIESIASVVVGGSRSSVPSTGISPRFSAFDRLCVSVIVFAFLVCIAAGISSSSGRREVPAGRLPARWEIAGFALPLLVSTVVVLLAFFPGNVNYDGSLQWVQAATRGELNPALGYPTTYLMRVLTFFSNSPSLLLLLQGFAGALGVSLVLREMRFLGVPRWAGFTIVLLMALTPQYAVFFTNVSKDALCTIGFLFVSWLLLIAFRQPPSTRLSLRLLVAIVFCALFAGLMRFNAMPVVAVVLSLALLMLYKQRRDIRLVVAGLMFFVLGLAIPQILVTLASQEIRRYKPVATQVLTPAAPQPSGQFARFYIYHFFSAAVATGTPIAPADAELFYRIAPPNAWAKYDCRMTDTTFIAVTNGMLLKPSAYADYLQSHQADMAKAVIRIVLRHPSLLLERQMCITDMLWHINIGSKPFQTTATLGYDNVDERFLMLAGESRSLLPAVKQVLQSYQNWTESKRWFWLFWAPALPLSVGFFIVFIYLRYVRNKGVLVVTFIPLLSISLLFLVIPFPAYRYAYPSVLMILLLGSLAFVRPLSHHKQP